MNKRLGDTIAPRWVESHLAEVRPDSDDSAVCAESKPNGGKGDPRTTCTFCGSEKLTLQQVDKHYELVCDNCAITIWSGSMEMADQLTMDVVK